MNLIITFGLLWWYGSDLSTGKAFPSESELSWPNVLYYCSECFIFLNTIFFIAWLWKGRATIEDFIFAAELLPMKIEVEELGGLCYKFCILGKSLVRNTKNPADLMWRLFQVDWIEITCVSGTSWQGLIMEMDEDINDSPTVPRQGSCSLTGECGYPGQWQAKYNGSISDMVIDAFPPVPPYYGLAGSEGYLAMEVTLAKNDLVDVNGNVVHTLCYCM